MKSRVSREKSPDRQQAERDFLICEPSRDSNPQSYIAYVCYPDTEHRTTVLPCDKPLAMHVSMCMQILMKLLYSHDVK